jgi:hypothetical protein
MKLNSFIVVGLVMVGSSFFSSCVQKNYYGVTPNNNNNNNNTSTQYVFDEEFNGADNYGWSFTDAADSAYASITGGSYQYVDYSAVKSNMSSVNTGVNVQNNFTVTTRVKSNNMIGLIIGASTTSNGYAFYIDTAGNYSLYQEGNGVNASIPIIPSTQDTLYAHKNDWNILEVDQTNGVWTAYINGTQVFTMAARALDGPGFGFKILPGTTGYADYLTVRNN